MLTIFVKYVNFFYNFTIATSGQQSKFICIVFIFKFGTESNNTSKLFNWWLVGRWITTIGVGALCLRFFISIFSDEIQTKWNLTIIVFDLFKEKIELLEPSGKVWYRPLFCSEQLSYVFRRVSGRHGGRWKMLHRRLRWRWISGQADRWNLLSTSEGAETQ